MGKKSKRAKGKAVAKAAASGVQFAVGERVKVKAGEYGNALGTVKGVRGGHKHITVLPDAHAHDETATVEFPAANLDKLP